MTPEEVAEWIELGMRLRTAGPEKYEQVKASLHRVVDAQEIISSHDWQLFLRSGRPVKRYES